MKEVLLTQGWLIGGVREKSVQVGFFNVGDMLDAENVEGELARGLFLLGRRIKRVGAEEVSITVEMLRKLSAGDIAQIQQAADELDAKEEAVSCLGER